MAVASQVLQSLSSPIPLAVDATTFVLPRTAVLRSSATNRSIQLSVDGGIEFFQPQYDASSGTLLAVSIVSPVTTVRFNGASGDLWGIQ